MSVCLFDLLLLKQVTSLFGGVHLVGVRDGFQDDLSLFFFRFSALQAQVASALLDIDNRLSTWKVLHLGPC